MPNNSLPLIKICKNNSCGNVATSYKGFCPKHSPYARIKSYSSRPMPRKLKNPIGVELEMFHPQGQHSLTPISQYVCCDGSLPNGGVEIKAVADSKRIGDKAADITQRARFAGAQVNSRCGFHVHLDKAFALPQLCSVVRTEYYNRITLFANTVQDYFFDIMPPSRKNNVYCQPIDQSSITSHHCWLSMSHAVPTIEVRLHGGTLNPWKVKAWIEVCICIQQAILAIVTADNPDYKQYSRFSDMLPYSSLGKKYLLARETSNVLTSFGFPQ
jgi:hypothetical protein